MAEPPINFLWHQRSLLLSWFSWPLFKDRFQKIMTRRWCNFPFAKFILWLNCVAFICCCCFPWYFTPGLFGETGLGTEVAVCKDKSLEEKPENVAELLTQYFILRLTDLLTVSTKANLTCEANLLRGHCAVVTTFLLNCKDTLLPALTFSHFPFLFESPSPYGLIYPFLIGRVGERWRKIHSRIVYSRCPAMNHPSCLSTSPKVSH